MAVAIGIYASTCCGAGSAGCSGFLPLGLRGLICFSGMTNLPPLRAFMSRLVIASATAASSAVSKMPEYGAVSVD
eukprot:454722-Prymnesium_polylepis.1